MTVGDMREDEGPAPRRRLAVWVLRLAGLAMFGLGLAAWVRLVGIYGGPLWRFDLMPFQWRIFVPALAVLYPIAGIGLWMGVSWGVAVWVIVAAIEAGAWANAVAVVEPAGIVPALHLAGLVLLLAIRLVSLFTSRRKAL